MELHITAKFKRDYKRCKKQELNLLLLKEVIDLLLLEKPLPDKYKDHALTGNFSRFRECHIQPDWLLLYYISYNKLVLTLARTGTHSDLLKM